MLLQQDSRGTASTAEQGFGKVLEALRFEYNLKQATIYKRVGWSPDRYSRLESGERPPLFKDLPSIALAFRDAGVSFTLQGLHEFLTAARNRIALQRTYKDEHSDDEWVELFQQLASELGVFAPASERFARPSPPQILEIRHLIKREAWRQEVLGSLEEAQHKKLLIIRGAPGVGKSSEISWIVMYLSRRSTPPVRVVLCDFRSIEPVSGPEAALRFTLGTLLTELRCSLPQTDLLLDEQTTLLIDNLERLPYRLVVVLDHGECLLQASGYLANCWERFFSRILRSGHRMTFIVATRQWPGWYGDEQIFVAERTVPSLSRDESVQLLRQLGLSTIPMALLSTVAERVGGIPRGLEWVVALVKQPLATEEWREAFAFAPQLPESDNVDHLTYAVERLLEEPHLFAGSLADDIAPLLDRIIENQRLSGGARLLLEVLSVASIPLGQPALATICRAAGTRPLKELQRASLLVSYEQRVHVNTIVAAAVVRRLGQQERLMREDALIEAYQAWLHSGQCYEREAGSIVYELTKLLLDHHRLLDAAQYAIRYGWLAFNLGYARQLAAHAAETIDPGEWPTTEDNVCGQLLLHYFLSPFLGVPLNDRQRLIDCRRLLDASFAGVVQFWPLTEVYLTRLFVAFIWVPELSEDRFEEAQALFQKCKARMGTRTDPDLQAALHEVHALLLTRWSDFAEEKRDWNRAASYREQTIQLYREGCALLSGQQQLPPLTMSLLKKRLARLSTNLGYQLDLLGRYEEALPILEQSILLKEQGFTEPGSLAASYGEKSQALAALGRYEEALRYDALALVDIERLANAGDTVSQEERWIYLVNRACLYLALQRIDEAEALLKPAKSNILPTRRKFSMLAKKALDEIEAWRDAAASSTYQRDWRWAGRLREATSFDAFWWLAHAGPFTPGEQREWDYLAAQPADEQVQKKMEALISQARQRELAAALAEEREPRLWYPAIPIEDVQARIARLLALDTDVTREEPNRVICDLYRETIAEYICFLRLIEAAYNQDREQFQECNRCIYPEPTQEEMQYALDRVKRLVRLGLQHMHTRQASQEVLRLMHDQLHLPIDPLQEADDDLDQQASAPLSPTQGQQLLSAQTLQRFLEAALRESGSEGWRVLIDLNANATRVEAASRLLILPNYRFSLEEIKLDLLQNEVIHHIGDAIAGERSPLGILSIGTAGYMPISEGRALYHEMQTTAALGQVFDDSKAWLGTLSAGLATGVVSPPQSFRLLYVFLRAFLVLYRLIRRPDQDEETAQKTAHDLALTLCLRAFRGVPELEKPGVCYSKDVVYLRGLLLIQRTVAEDVTILDRLAVGRIALEHLPAIEQLGIVPPLQPLRKLAQDSIFSGMESWVLTPGEKLPPA